LANSRTVRSVGGRPIDLLETDRQSMLELPPVDPPTGLSGRVRLGRDYYVRLDTVDYSVDPRAIGRFVDVTASLDTVAVTCDGRPVARHTRSWARHGVVTDPEHAAAAARMRQALGEDRRRRAVATRHHPDGHAVTMRALPDYDALFGVDFTHNSSEKKASSE
jgi:hypothetical protein